MPLNAPKKKSLPLPSFKKLGRGRERGEEKERYRLLYEIFVLVFFLFLVIISDEHRIFIFLVA